MTPERAVLPDSGPRDIAWSVGAFTVRLSTGLAGLRDRVAFLYRHHPPATADTFIDFPVRLDGVDIGLRRLVRPRVAFSIGGQRPFYPGPRQQASLLLETGLNWLIATEMYGYLLLHAAVIARGSDAMVLPAPAGSGKSTLAAGLMAAGWRLLSDEFTVIDPATGEIRPCLKGVSLKETAIDLMRARLPGEVMDEVYTTDRGRIALLRPSEASARAVTRPARIRWVISPRFAAGRPLQLQRVPRSEAFMTMASNAFNYDMLAHYGFRALADAMSGAEAYALDHGDLDAAVAAVERLASDG
jgi:hypothetical protein